MTLKDLEAKGWIKPFKASQTQIQNLLRLANRDILTAKQLIGSDSDWAFSIAYNAVLQAARALMFSKGYRPAAREGHHVACVRFAEAILKEKLGDEIEIFDKMRSKRHRAIYDVAGTVSLQEARAAFNFAVSLVKIINENLIQKRSQYDAKTKRAA